MSESKALKTTYQKYDFGIKAKSLRKMGSQYKKLSQKTGRAFSGPAIFVDADKHKAKFDKGTTLWNKPESQKIVKRYEKHQPKIERQALKDFNTLMTNVKNKGWIKAGGHAAGATIKDQVYSIFKSQPRPDIVKINPLKITKKFMGSITNKKKGPY